MKAIGAEVGMRTRVGDWVTAVALFALELDSELVFVGDGGATEASRPSRRHGIEWTNSVALGRLLSFGADLTWTDSEFTDRAPEGSEIPGAISRTVAAGLVLSEVGRTTASLRWRYFADVPLIEDGSSIWSSSSVVNASVGVRIGQDLRLRLDVFNALDREDSDVEYFYASRLPGEPTEGVEDVHFHPLEKRGARLTLDLRF